MKKVLSYFKGKLYLSIFTACFLCLAAFLLYMKLTPKDGILTTVSKASLEKIIETNELATLDYTYNAIATVLDESGENEKYYVSYEGIVTAGIDPSKISVDEQDKNIIITLPEAEIQDTDVKIDSLDFIFTKSKYETETVSHEAHQACMDDLKQKAAKETSLLTLARENAVNSVTALLSPWINQLDEEYTVEIK